MANIFKQGTFQGFGQSASARTLQYTTQNTTAGSMLWCAVATETSAGHSTVTVSDDQNGNWTQAGTYSQLGTVRDISIWYFPNSKGGVKPIVTVTPSASVYMGLCIGEHTTTTTTVSVDHTANSTTSGSSSSVTGTVVVSQSGTLVIAACGSGDNNSAAVTATAPFTIREDQSNGSSFEQCSVATDESASANEACTFNFTGNHTVMNIIASFNVGTSGNTYNETGAGGSVVGGSPTPSVVCSKTASGGIVNGGVGTPFIVCSKTASGGIVSGGVATIQEALSVTASGGSVCGSSAAPYVVVSKTASGGIVNGGVATVVASITPALSGGSVCGGAATGYTPSIVMTYQISSSTRLTLSISSSPREGFAINTHPSDPFEVGSSPTASYELASAEYITS